MKTHHDLKVWKYSIQFVKEIYTISKQFPVDERYALISQIRRAAVSVPSNIAEGAAAIIKKNLFNFYIIL